MDPAAFKYLAIATTILGMIGAAIAVANIFSSLLNSIARNPSAEAKMAKYAIIGAGMAEAMGIFALCIAMILIFQ
jgi:F-type H+-transporting ATPase subunit c